MKVRWTERAENDLAGQCTRIALDDPGLAARLGGEVLARVGGLAEFPYRGRSGRAAGTRELVLAGLPWIAVYVIGSDTVTILRLLHGAQSWPPDGENLDVA